MNETRIAEVQRLLERFCRDDAGRSVALSLGPAGGRTRLAVNGDVVRPVASVIKVALVMALYDRAGRGEVALDDEVPVAALGATRYCSIMRAFDRGRALSLRELAAIALITSDNPVAVLIEERVGRKAVSEVLVRAGVAPVRASMRAGFREAELGAPNRANAMSARDVVGVFEALAAEPCYRPIVVALENNLRNARIPALLPDEAVVAHKTGSLNGVVNDAGEVRLGGRGFVVAFLSDGQADPARTGQDIAVCSKAVFDVVMAA